MLVSDARYGSHRRQNRRCDRGDNLHNPLKSLFLRHNRLIDFLPFYPFTFKSVSFARNGRAASVSAATALRVVTSLRAAALIVGTR